MVDDTNKDKQEKPKVETPEEEGEKTEETTEEEDSSSSQDLIDKANLAADRQEEANKKHEALLKKQEKLQAEEIVRGRGFAGAAPGKPKRLTDTEYAEALQRGEVNPLKEDGFLK